MKCYKSSMFSKAASTDDLRMTEGIMEQIRAEDPSYWPYGLSTDQFDGGLYLINKSASTEPVGFVGWQARQEGERRVGYYAIGVLPEHRGQGMAKKAVTGIIREKSGSFDEVKALVMSHNGASKALAKSLDIPVMEKQAGKLQSILGALGKGTATASLLDLAVNKDKGAVGRYALGNEDADPWSATDFGMNFLAGSIAPWKRNVPLATALTGLAAGKTIAAPAVRKMDERNEIFKGMASTMAEKETPKKSIPTAALVGAGGLGLGALGVAAYRSKKNNDFKKQQLEDAQKGRVKITLPTQQKGDSETEIELPFDELNLSNALRGRLSRDTRRRLYAETRQRTRTRKPRDPSNPTDKEREDMELEKETAKLDKAASIADFADFLSKEAAPVAPPATGPGSVPTPPQLNNNPAHRMQQQAASAKSIDTSTEANPQIMKAEQAAMQAQQEGAAQAAQLEQQAQAAQMEQQQQFQAELSKANQEKETLKIQLEKTKAEADLAKQKQDGVASASSGEGQAVVRLASSRLDRVGKKISGIEKMATAAMTPTGAPKPAPGAPLRLRAGDAQAFNSSPYATRQLPNVGVYRHSYGKLGDSIYDMLLRAKSLTPKPPQLPAVRGFSQGLGSLIPQGMGMLRGAYQGATNHLAFPSLNANAYN